MEKPILQAKEIKKYFPLFKGVIIQRLRGLVKAVDGVSFSVRKGKTFGLVGESGCGKSTTAKLILMLEDITSGSIIFDDQDLKELSKSDLNRYRRRVQAVFQNPYGSLNPRIRVEDIIAEPLVVNSGLPGNQIKEKVADMLDVVGLGRDKGYLYPHEFSGGQRQRIAIARALMLQPELIVLDEPVSALDVSIRAQILNLLMEIQEQFGIAYLLIAHDLAVVKHMSHQVGVMYLGRLVEIADSHELFENPLHPYTRALYSAALPSHPCEDRNEIILVGEVPSPLNPPGGCSFHPRCPEAKSVCARETPALADKGSSHLVACHA